MALVEAVAARRSVRGFLPTEVPRETLTRVFETAQRAPSWCNVQPWHVAVFSGRGRDALIARLGAAVARGAPSFDFPFPGGYPEPYGARRRESGKALYVAMGIPRDDLEGRKSAWMRNFVAFDAPHVALVGLDKRIGLYAALDVGCWLQTLLLAATAEGLGTCAQAALATFADDVRPLCGWEEHVGLAFGLAIGFEDGAVPANAARTTRAPLAENVRFFDELSAGT